MQVRCGLTMMCEQKRRASGLDVSSLSARSFRSSHGPLA